MKTIRTDSENKDFVELVHLLDADLAQRDGEDHAFYKQFNKIDTLKYVVIVVENDIPLGCGAMKHYDDSTMEIKRMFTSIKSRGKGIASMILSELEKWAVELSFKKCVLETGTRQHEAIALYKKRGYVLTPNYGQYTEVEDSRCFAKQINSPD